ncbi:MAG: peptidylprolyl isomerase [Candidatus Pacearchaeota archaeon]
MYSFLVKDTSNSNPKVLLITTEGNITLELYSDKAPITVKNFLTYVDEGFYDGTVFHRVIKGFMIQGGGFTLDGKKKPTHNPIILESDNGLKNEIGSIAMARSNIPDSATSQFFINTADNFFLNKGVRDEGYAVFGRVISGMDVVYKIENTLTTTKYGMSDWPRNDIIIIKAKILE